MSEKHDPTLQGSPLQYAVTSRAGHRAKGGVPAIPRANQQPPGRAEAREKPQSPLSQRQPGGPRDADTQRTAVPTGVPMGSTCSHVQLEGGPLRKVTCPRVRDPRRPCNGEVYRKTNEEETPNQPCFPRTLGLSFWDPSSQHGSEAGRRATEARRTGALPPAARAALQVPVVSPLP